MFFVWIHNYLYNREQGRNYLLGTNYPASKPSELIVSRGGENRTPDPAPPARCVTIILLPDTLCILPWNVR